MLKFKLLNRFFISKKSAILALLTEKQHELPTQNRTNNQRNY